MGRAGRVWLLAVAAITTATACASTEQIDVEGEPLVDGGGAFASGGRSPFASGGFGAFGGFTQGSGSGGFAATGAFGGFGATGAFGGFGATGAFGGSGDFGGVLPGASGGNPGGELGTGGSSSGGSAGQGAGGRSSGGSQSSGGAKASGGSAGSTSRSTGGAGGSNGGGSAGSGGTPTCGATQKICGGMCTDPTPTVGCGPTGCDPCATAAPANGFLKCTDGMCDFDCLSGYTKSATGCDAPPPENKGSCPNSAVGCPDCGAVFGPGCCNGDKCGCSPIPWTVGILGCI